MGLGGATVGGVIGGFIGSIFGPVGTGVGATLGAMLGGASGGDDDSPAPNRKRKKNKLIHIERASPILNKNGTLKETLYLEYVGGDIRAMLEKGNKAPCTASHICTTIKKNQKSFSLRVLRGPTASKTVHLATVIVSGIGLAPAGGPQIKVTLSVTEGGDIYFLGLNTNPAKRVTIRRK